MTSPAAVIIGYDGSPGAERALRDSAVLLGLHRALIVTVWEAGRAFEAATLPVTGLELPPTVLDIRAAVEADQALYENAERTAERGAVVARQAGYADAAGIAVADELSVADTLIRLSREHLALGIVVGSHGHHRLAELLLGSTSSTLVRKADVPVVVVRGA